MEQYFEFSLCTELYENNNRSKVTVPKSQITGIENNDKYPNMSIVHVGMSTKYYVKSSYNAVVSIVYGNDITVVPETENE